MGHALYLVHPKTGLTTAGIASGCGPVRLVRTRFVMAWAAALSYRLAVALPRPAHPLHGNPEAPLV